MNLQSVKQRFGIIGRSELLDRALNTAVRVAGTELSVLIQGASGVGKEVFSKIIHNLSPRKHNKLIAINCGAIPEGTINSELFGHEKGAFTGASSERKGYFETVNGGTIFLDEIGEMPLDTQAYLLRVLESGEFIRVGSSKVQKTDVRVLAATNVSLEDKIRTGKFREDLYYRLNTVPIKVPSLQERREDIHILFRKFAADFAERYRTEAVRLDDQAQLILENYKWPGNIRELKNVVEQLSVLSENKTIDADSLVYLVPNIVSRNLPAIRANGDSESSMYEREILYKLLFEMKNDVNDLKALIYELIRNNNLSVPDITHFKQLTAQTGNFERDTIIPNDTPSFTEDSAMTSRPVLINSTDDYQNLEVVDENLSLEEMERDMIKKALKKYKGRRKDAAEELGISERTLYRKIKQYEIQE